MEKIQNLLVATGGGLNLQKCKWMIINETSNDGTDITTRRPTHEIQQLTKVLQQYDCEKTFSNLHRLPKLCFT